MSRREGSVGSPSAADWKVRNKVQKCFKKMTLSLFAFCLPKSKKSRSEWAEEEREAKAAVGSEEEVAAAPEEAGSEEEVARGEVEVAASEVEDAGGEEDEEPTTSTSDTLSHL